MITIDQFICGFEKSARNLPDVLSEWNTIDPELQTNYIEQFQWLLNARDQMLSIAALQNRKEEIIKRLEIIEERLRPLRDEINLIMGIPIE
jgi:hypothetical protein